MGAANVKESYDSYAASLETTCTADHFSNAPTDSNGCREFPSLPPPGTHPRLFFTEKEIPTLLARINHSEIGDIIKKVIGACHKHFVHFYGQFQDLEECERQNPTEPTLKEFFQFDDGRNTAFLGTYIHAFLEGDFELMNQVKDMVLFYAKVVINSRDYALTNEVTDKPFSFWHTKDWDVAAPWLIGGSAVSLLYDVMFNDMSLEERDIVRRSIAIACKGRRSWGMDLSSRRMQSNWGPYHGELLVMEAVIEGEEGFDGQVYTMFSDMMLNFMNFGVYESGHPVEDSYALNFSFREGSLCMLAMARRGFNLFNHPSFKKMWTCWLPFALEPHSSGKIYGGSSGNDWYYPTAAMLAKYVFPKDPVIDFVYRKYMCPDGAKYPRITKYQSRLPALVFTVPSLCDGISIDEQAEKINLPLTFSCRNRGKVIMRSDWSQSALCFTLDARPDAFLIGHDVPSRGAFVLHASGRTWGQCPEWNCFRHCCHYSLPSIDGKAQEDKAPSVKLLDIKEGALGSTFAAADLSYAYNWEWITWAREDQDMTSKGYEREFTNPRDFGMDCWWLPQKLYGEPFVAFCGLYQWRKRFNTVEKVTRSSIMVRGSNSYVILVDNVKMDAEMHNYEWSMTTPNDVTLESFDGKDAVLKETGEEGRRFLIRHLDAQSCPLECTFEEFRNTDGDAKECVTASRIKFFQQSDGVTFRLLMYPLPAEGCESPSTSWNDDSSILHVEGGNHSEKIAFGEGSHGEATMEVIDDAVEATI